MRRSRKKNRYIQLHLDLAPKLMAEVTHREERIESFNLLPKALIFKHKIVRLDPFFLEITEENII